MNETEPRVASFLRSIMAILALFFALGTLFNNGVALLATDEALKTLGDIPTPLFWFDFLMGWGYLFGAIAMFRKKRWAMALAWTLAVLHSFSASAVWLWFLTGHPVDQGVLVMVLLREGFWVSVGGLLWKIQPQKPAPPAPKAPPA